MVQNVRVGKKHFSEKKFGRRKSLKEWISGKASKFGLKKRHDEDDPHNFLEEFRQMKINEYDSKPHAPSYLPSPSKSCDSPDWKHNYLFSPGRGDVRSPHSDDSSCSSLSSRRFSTSSSSSLSSTDSPPSLHPLTLDDLMSNLTETYNQQRSLSLFSDRKPVLSTTESSRQHKKRVRRQSSKSTKAMKPPLKKSKHISQIPSFENPDIPSLLEQVAKVVWLQVVNFQNDQMVDLEWDMFVQPRPEQHQKGETPTLQEIVFFVKHLNEKSTPSEECVLISLIFLHRLIRSSSFRLHSRNWVSAFFTASLIAQKIWDDESWINEHFGYFCPDWENQTINKMESSFLVGMDWDCTVSVGEYADYFERLYLLAEESGAVSS